MPRISPTLTERDFWGRVKNQLHVPSKFMVAWKIEDKYKSGLPDVLGCVQGESYLMELKVCRHINMLNVDISSGQLAHMLQWSLAGGSAYVLVCWIARAEWFLFKLPNSYLSNLSLPWVMHYDVATDVCLAHGGFDHLKELGSILVRMKPGNSLIPRL